MTTFESWLSLAQPIVGLCQKTCIYLLVYIIEQNFAHNLNTKHLWRKNAQSYFNITMVHVKNTQKDWPSNIYRLNYFNILLV